MGANTVDIQATKAEVRLNTLTYHGEKKRWNFERYVRETKDQHAILDRLTAHGYAGIDERSKVRMLMAGIKTKDLDPVKVRIMSDQALRTDLDACVNLFQDFIEQNRSHTSPTRDASVAAMQTHADRRLGNKRTQTMSANEDLNSLDESQADMTVPDRYYKMSEYKKLTPAQKLGLKIKRLRRGGNQGSKDPKKAKTVRFNTRQVAAVTARASGSDSDGEMEEGEVPQTTQRPSNRTNSALRRRA